MTLSRRRMIKAGLATVGAMSLLKGASADEDRIEDQVIVDGLNTSRLDEAFVERIRRGGVDSVHLSMDGALTYGKAYHFLDKNSDSIVLAKSVGDIIDAKAQGRIALIFGNQDALVIESELVKTWRFATLIQTLEAYHGLGLRIMGICYNTNNVFGGGILNPESPLTRSGHRLVEETHKLNIILDVGGHTGERTSLDAIEMSQGIPVICTHTNMAGLMPNVRAASDRLCEAVAATGGVVGLTAFSDFIIRSKDNYKAHGKTSPQATLNQHLDQYDYLKRLVGIDHMALGTDFNGGAGSTYFVKTEDSAIYTPDMLSDGFPRLVQGFQSLSELGNVISGLEKRGWTQEELAKLLGGNWMRVYSKVWGR
jgi:membrane dipeptidase